MNRIDEAIANYDRAIAIDPAYTHAYNNRGISLCMAGRFEEAVASYNKALVLNPFYAEAYFNRGIALSWWKRAHDQREGGGGGGGETRTSERTSYERRSPSTEFRRSLQQRGDVAGRAAAEARASYDRALLRPDFFPEAKPAPRCKTRG